MAYWQARKPTNNGLTTKIVHKDYKSTYAQLSLCRQKAKVCIEGMGSKKVESVKSVESGRANLVSN